ncbi:MAG: M42 family metallopeptidase [Armatimonadetes bacterium]|nr:M42 family metallopeptidase [Akkermansiaceae bacterium]
MRNKALSLLQELTEAHSISGHEDEVRAIFIDELSEVGQLATDNNGSVTCAHGSGGPRVLIAAHMDEVGFMVQNITPDGFIQFVMIGGWWEQVLLGQRVQILTRSGEKIIGVIGTKPVHFLQGTERNQIPGVEQMFIDVGSVSRREVEVDFQISIGDPIAPWSPFTALAKSNHFMAKAFDNRVGMAGVIQSAHALADTGHPNEIVFAGSVQEEVGLRGARTLANFVKPDVAIILEGPPADDIPGLNPWDSQGKLGRGVQIRLYDPSAITNPRLAQLTLDVAREEGIAHQVTVRRNGGTDAGAIHQANFGIPCVVLGTPARYIHSHNSIIDVEDYFSMVSLVIALAGRLDDEAVRSLTSYI